MYNRITKVRSRQAVKLPAVQPVVMWTPALGRYSKLNKENNYGKEKRFSKL